MSSQKTTPGVQIPRVYPRSMTTPPVLDKLDGRGCDGGPNQPPLRYVRQDVTPLSNHTMFQLQLGNAALVATGIRRSTENPSMAVVTFTNGTEAGVTISPAKLSTYWDVLADGNVAPKFLSADGKLMPSFTVKAINGGKPVIVEAASSKPLTW